MIHFFGCKYDSVFIIPYMTVFLWFWPCMSASCLTVGVAFFCVADSSLQLVSWALWLLTPALWRGAYVGDLTSLLCLVANSCPPEIQSDPKSSQSELQSTKENHGSPNPSQNYKTIWQCWWWAEMELNPSPLCKSTFWAAIRDPLVSLLEFPTVSWFPILCPIIYYKE